MSNLLGIITDIAITGGALLLALGYLKLFELSDDRREIKGSSLSSVKRSGLRKKVRFAEDVVERSGDGKGLRRHRAEEVATSGVRISRRPPARKSAADGPHLNDSAFAKPPPQGKFQTLAKPEIPANRLVLYEGKRQDYLQRISCACADHYHHGCFTLRRSSGCFGRTVNIQN